ncbi:MAG: GNAT family N-acetyltransferase [Elusimicrobia bacterium]|nr:GNAT family N-acetyltransferase [Elusimicrobiota bacterium]
MPPAKGRRLALKPLEDSDAPKLFAAVAASREHLRRRLRWVASASGTEACRAFISSPAGRSAFGIFETKTGGLAGVAALQPASAAAGGPVEVSAWVRADKIDRGYGVEAGRLLVAAAFRREGTHKLAARIDPTNRAARKALRRLGFRYEGCLRREKRLNGRWIDQECWGLLREEWKR